MRNFTTQYNHSTSQVPASNDVLWRVMCVWISIGYCKMTVRGIPVDGDGQSLVIKTPWLLSKMILKFCNEFITLVVFYGMRLTQLLCLLVSIMQLSLWIYRMAAASGAEHPSYCRFLSLSRPNLDLDLTLKFIINEMGGWGEMVLMLLSIQLVQQYTCGWASLICVQ